MKYSRLFLAIVMPVTMLLLFMATLQTKASPSATFTVNSTIDAIDVNPGDGVCETALGNGVCTLRAAVMEANALAGADQIYLPSEIYTRTIGGISEDASAGDLNITDDLRMFGSDPDSTIINGNALDRIFMISNGAEVYLENISIFNGNTPGAGGGIFIESGASVTIGNSKIISNVAGVGGGGIDSRSSLTITNSAINNNKTLTGGSGGGIVSLSPYLGINNSTISGNIASSRGGGVFTTHDGVVEFINVTIYNNVASGYGGAITNLGPKMSLVNVTVSSNHSDFQGGAIDNHGILTVTNSTIVSNTGSSGVGGIYNNPTNNGTAYLQNTIIAFNNNENCGGIPDSIFSLGNNLEDTNLCSLNEIGDLVNQNPLIDILADNGGDILSHALFPTSPAIDTANPVNCPSYDQRNYPRPFDGDGDETAVCDIGAVEYGALPFTYIYLPLISKP